MNKQLFFLSGFFFLTGSICTAQSLANKPTFTHADTLRGSITPERAWWNVLHYDIRVTPDYEKKSIKGETTIRWQSVAAGQTLQIDLQQPMKITSMEWRHKHLTYRRDSNVFFVRLPSVVAAGRTESITIKFEGLPHEAIQPPWDGGWIWRKDEKGRPWMSIACQGLGASVWFPCKDHLSDEPDSGISLHITVPDSLTGIGNGRLREKKENGDGTTTYTWVAISPVNSYDIAVYIGKYAGWSEIHAGVKGPLDCSFYALDYNLEKAKQQFRQVDTMLRSMEYWAGPYPFYEDGYKLVEAPFLGMEHQSAIAYGNRYQNGYEGTDKSTSGWGLMYDFIIVHESAHEWFGNSITDKDIADEWIHEAFGLYLEGLYLTYLYGPEAGNDYVIGMRRLIDNERPPIGSYGVNNEGSKDLYFKGSNMLHMIRQIMGDTAFRGLLHGLQRAFYHQTVTTQQIEEYISTYAHKDFSKIFDQYLRTTQIPILQYRADGNNVSYRWTNCVKGFSMPVKVYVGGLPEQWIIPTEDWQTIPAGTGGEVIQGEGGLQAADLPLAQKMRNARAEGSGPGILLVGPVGNASAGDGGFSVDKNFYIIVRKQ